MVMESLLWMLVVLSTKGEVAIMEQGKEIHLITMINLFSIFEGGGCSDEEFEKKEKLANADKDKLRN